MIPFITTVEELHIENSSICPAACPQCDREIGPSDKTWFDQKFLPTEFFEKRIPDEVYKTLKNISFSGIMGDPCAAPNTLEVIDILKSKGDFEIYIHTNGGMKTPSWWAELATKLGPNDTVQFGIDGLEDTNHIHRVNINWNKLMNNVQAFIDAGGNAIWQFIAFRHNEHQIEEARALSKEMGFKSFMSKQGARFSLDYLLNEKRYGAGGVLIEPPLNDKLRNEVMNRNLTSNLDEWFERSKNTEIKCFARHTNSIYINSDGQMLPCYFVGAYKNFRKHKNLPDTWNELIAQENENINLFTNEWDRVISSEFFKKIRDGWLEDFKNGRLFICAGNCSSFDGSLNNIPELMDNKGHWFYNENNR